MAKHSTFSVPFPRIPVFPSNILCLYIIWLYIYLKKKTFEVEHFQIYRGEGYFKFKSTYIYAVILFVFSFCYHNCFSFVYC